MKTQLRANPYPSLARARTQTHTHAHTLTHTHTHLAQRERKIRVEVIPRPRKALVRHLDHPEHDIPRLEIGRLVARALERHLRAVRRPRRDPDAQARGLFHGTVPATDGARLRKDAPPPVARAALHLYLLHDVRCEAPSAQLRTRRQAVWAG